MKKGDARRSELLATAEKLFYTKGYEKTSIQDILDEVGFSKGGFYHHFDSKLSVLEAICEQRAQEICQSAALAVAEGNRTATEKLNALLASSTLWQSDNPGFVTLLIQVAYRQDGALMREKMKDCQLSCMQGVLETVLREGVQSGEFFVEDVESTAGLILRLYMQFADEIAFLFAQEKKENDLCEAAVLKMRAYRTAIERVLLAPFGSISLIDAKDLRALAQKILNDKRPDETINS